MLVDYSSIRGGGRAWREHTARRWYAVRTDGGGHDYVDDYVDAVVDNDGVGGNVTDDVSSLLLPLPLCFVGVVPEDRRASLAAGTSESCRWPSP